jgi:hypothetical protein
MQRSSRHRLQAVGRTLVNLRPAQPEEPNPSPKARAFRLEHSGRAYEQPDDLLFERGQFDSLQPIDIYVNDRVCSIGITANNRL